MFALAKLAESRDDDTGEHMIRVRSYSQILAEQLRRDSAYASQISAQFLDDLHRTSPLHDIGKVAVSDTILLKPGRLTPQELGIMKTHTVLGAKTLEQVVSNSEYGGFLAMAVAVAKSHHERFDGTGYPEGLKGRGYSSRRADRRPGRRFRCTHLHAALQAGLLARSRPAYHLRRSGDALRSGDRDRIQGNVRRVSGGPRRQPRSFGRNQARPIRPWNCVSRSRHLAKHWILLKAQPAAVPGGE